MAVICVGQSVYDIVIPYDEALVENQKYRVNSRLECGGGPALNAAYLCAVWGEQAYLISRIGEDDYGKKIRSILLKAGVHIEYLVKGENIETPYSIILSNRKNGSRTIFNFPGEIHYKDYEYPDLDADVILSDGHLPELSLQAIRRYPDALSVLDAGTCRESTMEVAPHVDYIVCSEDFARQYTGKAVDLEQPELCREIFGQIKGINKRQAVITLGEKGLLYEEDGELKHLPAYPAKAVDTSGAGDIFHGAFAYGLAKKMPLPAILKMSSMASSISVESLGGQTSIPALDLVERKLKEQER
ncbi:PfkB family carbohydrate kinase [Anaerostipes sp.]|uniref:PfkB family carbohydrate kinase n=1 Tax=Anaerostipes sp. TaxID=1872530 RepID=UPI0025C3D626|nr:PfkB family carbohydrate kinase [Anaerostipes sp.]MBS7006935.1 carbohydrate kinase [Anaerostipes sp.]